MRTWLVLIALALGCPSADDDTGADTDTAADTDTGADTATAGTSSLQVWLTGAPTGASATVLGPDGYSQAVTADTLLDELHAGLYAVIADPLAVDGVGYWPAVTPMAVTLEDDDSDELTVRWSPATPTIDADLDTSMTVSAGQQADIVVWHPHDVDITLTAEADDATVFPGGAIVVTDLGARLHTVALNAAAAGRTTLTLTATDSLGVATAVPHPLVVGDVMVTTDADDGPGSLREALATAPADGVVVFADDVRGAIDLDDSLELSTAVVLLGPGPDALSLNARQGTRLMDVSASLYVEGLAFRNGEALRGGAMYVTGTGVLHARDCLFEDNRVISEQFQSPLGAAVFVAEGGRPRFERCTFLNNHVFSGSYGGGTIAFRAPYGGDQELVLENCTFASNGATFLPEDGTGLPPKAAAVWTAGSARLVGNTIAGNDGGYLATATYAGQVTALELGANVLAGNQAEDFVDVRVGTATFTTLGGNVVGTSQGGTWNGPGDVTGVVDPLLDYPRLHGGLVPTMAPRTGSPVLAIVDTAALGGTLTTDARGRPRRVILDSGDPSDAGAFEVQPED